jgi:hypothetical protein
MIKNTVRRDRFGVPFAGAPASAGGAEGGADAALRDRDSVLGSIVVAMGSSTLSEC